MKRIVLAGLLTMALFSLKAQYNCQQTKQAFAAISSTAPINNNAKSDTVDIIHYDLDLDFTRVQNGQMRGVCTITATPKMNGVTKVNLELLALNVDSVILNNSVTPSYTYSSGPHFRITLPSAMSVGDTFTLAIYYYGNPMDDLSGWGGFHFANPYYFNLGVGFAANPHTFGRSWFPCFDNFVEKSTYSFHIKTANGRKAYCNGIRTAIDSSTFAGDTIVSHWEQNDPIPTYLASVAISDYHEMSYVHAGKEFLLLGRTNDTANISGSFANLPQIYDAQVNSYGLYQWQKVGYALTTIGAMEHANSIHYPRNIVDGSLNNEDIIAHELAHHWFGNLVTCETAGDMWINEGMAEFVSHQYQEIVYDRERYEDVILANHNLVINQAVIADGGHFALYDLPNELTYGTHTYQKGAMVAHNLRTYLGDPAFYNGLQSLLLTNSYGTLNSYQFRDQLANITGYDLTSFFDDWIFNPGYPEFNIDSMRVIHTAIPEPWVKVAVSQRQFATTKPFTNVPLRITLHDSSGLAQSHDVVYKGGDTVFSVLNAFDPQWANLNEDGYLLAGVSATDFDMKSTGFYHNNYCKMNVTVQSIGDSAKLRVEHHWAGPSRSGNEPFKISSSRYWRVSGHLASGFLANGEITFSSNAGNNFLDEDLLANGEDSLMLVYRKDAREPWREYDWYSKNYMGSPNNKFGRINVQVLIPGEFAFANGVSAFSLNEERLQYELEAYPNPASDSIRFTFNKPKKAARWMILNSTGKQLQRGKVGKGDESLSVMVNDLAAGVYFFVLDGESVPFVVK